MLRELVEAEERFSKDQDWVPAFYDRKVPEWVVDVTESGLTLLGKFKKAKAEFREVLAPVRYRSGKIGESDRDESCPDEAPRKSNLKPLLLLDKAANVFGISAPEKKAEAQRIHKAFCELLKKAAAETGDGDWNMVAEVAGKGLPGGAEWQKIKPGEFVAIRNAKADRNLFPCETPKAQSFWMKHVLAECLSSQKGGCSICGKLDCKLLQTLPQPVFVLDQKCQIASINQRSFESFGKKQATNLAICADCAARATSSLCYLLKHGAARHQAVLARDDRKGQKNPLRSHVAIFWTKQAIRPSETDSTHDLEKAFADFLGGVEKSREDAEGSSRAPPPDESQLEAMLKLPWTGESATLTLADNEFYLAILSANKGRLVVRDWLNESVENLRSNLETFVAAARVIGPNGESPRLLPLRALIDALRTPNADVPRGLLRTATAGQALSPCLVPAAAQRFRHPRPANERSDADALGFVAGLLTSRGSLTERKVEATRWALAALLKLALTHGRDDAKKKEARRMETLDTTRNVSAYLCGRLLAILEEIQLRAAEWKINATLVDRAYGTASTAPASIFGTLIRTAESGHLPKIRKQQNAVCDRLKAMLEEVSDRLDKLNGFPLTLPLKDQAEFALGFYCQRAEFRKERPRHKQEKENTATEGAEA